MDPLEIAEKHKDESQLGGKKLAAYIAGLAALLAVATLGGNTAADLGTNQNIASSDTWTFYQAKTIRQTNMRIAADMLQLEVNAHPEWPDHVLNAYREKIHEYKATADRYESEPETGDGKAELSAKARQHGEIRDRAGRQGPWFSAAEGSLQLAIVMASVAAIVSVPLLLYGSFVLGGLGCPDDPERLFPAVLIPVGQPIIPTDGPSVGTPAIPTEPSSADKPWTALPDGRESSADPWTPRTPEPMTPVANLRPWT